MFCAGNELMMMALQKMPDQAGTSKLVVAGSGASFTCPLKEQKGNPPGLKCTETVTCLSADQSQMTAACTLNGMKLPDSTSTQATGSMTCDQSYLGMMKPMFCAGNELMMMALQKMPDQAGTTKLVVA